MIRQSWVLVLGGCLLLGGCSTIDLIAHGIKSWGRTDQASTSKGTDEAPPVMPPTEEDTARRGGGITSEELPPP